MDFCIKDYSDTYAIQRIACHTRSGGPHGLHLECLSDAMKSKDTCLTSVALSGQRKQDVGDAERLFSKSVADFLRTQGHHEEAAYIQTVCDWHIATDGRGVSQLTRSKYNYKMLNYTLDELMPWNEQTYDFSLLEVNQ